MSGVYETKGRKYAYISAVLQQIHFHPQGYRLIILWYLHVNAAIEQLFKWMAYGGIQVSHCWSGILQISMSGYQNNSFGNELELETSQ